ncbi:MAG TPA: hypothetical protein ENI18_02030 [Candidatus Aminicenantes bacterium]|nr:hypothetical protein [Candidatus Aminicenantes bacterium]
MPKENDKGKESFEITEETEDKEDDVKSDGEEEMNDERADLKSKIKDNLKRAIEFQTEIKELTAKTLEGLEKMDDLSKMLEELYHKAEEKVESLEKDLEGKTTVPEGEKSEEEGVNFEHLLSKAKEIKEMLRKPGEIEPGGLEEEKEEKVEEEGAPEEEISPLEAADETAKGEAEEDAEIEPLSEEKEEPGIEEAPEEDISLLEAMDKTIKMKAGEEVEMEPVPEEKEEPGIEEAQEEDAPDGDEEAPAEEISPLEAMDKTITMKAGEEVEMEPVPEEKEEPGIEEAKEEDAPDGDEEEISPLEALDATIKIKPMEKLKKKAAQEEKRGAGGEEDEVSGFPKRRASDALEILEKYKKAEPEEEAEVVYYENGDKKILDSECIVSAVCSRLEEAEKLYKKLSKTESPIDQFFVKQEIIRSQEALRGVILAGTRMLEKESSVLPEYTIGVMNINVLKEILEKLSMQNWSKKTDFGLFTEYAAKLKKDYYARISSLVDYLKSLIEELGLEF